MNLELAIAICCAASVAGLVAVVIMLAARITKTDNAFISSMVKESLDAVSAAYNRGIYDAGLAQSETKLASTWHGLKDIPHAPRKTEIDLDASSEPKENIEEIY
jgi:hypothetical protein